METIKSGTGLDGEMLGTVVSNSDPLYLQRLQVRIPVRHDNVVDADLPWCIKSDASGGGHVAPAGSQDIPLVGSIVVVKFQNGDPHMPMYTSTVLTPAQVISVFQTNYPNRVGRAFPDGSFFYFDRLTKDFEFSHSSGTVIHINPDGSGTIDFAGNLTTKAPNWTHTGPVTFTDNIIMDQNLNVNGTLTVA
jgi:phage baseplate assembly protein gpV